MKRERGTGRVEKRERGGVRRGEGGGEGGIVRSSGAESFLL